MLQTVRKRLTAFAAVVLAGVAFNPGPADAFFCFSFQIGGGPRISYWSQNPTQQWYGPLIDYPGYGGYPGGFGGFPGGYGGFPGYGSVPFGAGAPWSYGAPGMWGSPYQSAGPWSSPWSGPGAGYPYALSSGFSPLGIGW